MQKTYALNLTNKLIINPYHLIGKLKKNRFFHPENICRNYRDFTPALRRYYVDITPTLHQNYGYNTVIKR